MQRALVVVEATEEVQWLVREAAELAAGVDAELHLLRVTAESEYERDRKAMADTMGMESARYDVDRAAEGARQFAEDLGTELLADLDVAWTALGTVGDKAEETLATATEEDCDHVFVSGRRRSPSGKAIFGDAAQKVLLNFDGPVTVVTGEEQ